MNYTADTWYLRMIIIELQSAHLNLHSLTPATSDSLKHERNMYEHKSYTRKEEQKISQV